MTSSHRPTARCSTQLTALPIDGRWVWDETKKSIVYKNVKGISRERISDGIEQLKMDLSTGRIQYRKQSWPVQHMIKTKENNKITVDDVIQAALNVMSEMFYIPIEFEEYVRTAEVREFLLYLLNYFSWFLDMMNNAAPKINRQIDRSNVEKQRIQFSYTHLLAALAELTCKYAVLLLGVNLKNFHHMRSGDLFYSCADIDRSTFESLIVLSTYFSWIAFYRQHSEIIRRELARLFRADGDIEMLNIPPSESLEGRIKNNLTRDPMTRHKLIDCNELFSTIEAKKKVEASISEMNHQKPSLLRSSSVRWTSRDTLHYDIDEKDNSTVSELHGRSPHYRQRHQRAIAQRQNRLRGILTRQLKSRNHSLINEQLVTNTKERISMRSFNREEIEEKIRQRQKINQQHLAMRRLLSGTLSSQHAAILPPPSNPLDDHRLYISKAFTHSPTSPTLPQVHFELNQNIGIIGRPYAEFDTARLTLKSNSEDTIKIPSNFLVALPDSLDKAGLNC